MWGLNQEQTEWWSGVVIKSGEDASSVLWWKGGEERVMKIQEGEVWLLIDSVDRLDMVGGYCCAKCWGVD